ncbi:MAG: hypothetical protein J6J86_01525 [Lachnospiraceae bacterium]|nr:hypothetical protein [Lachnospiraceae bacterium]
MMVKKLILSIVACTVLISLCKDAAMASQEQTTGEKSTDEIIYLAEEDAILNNFLSLHLMSEDFEMSEPEVRVIMTQEQNGHFVQVSDKLSCTVYRFTYEKYGEQVCQTIVDMSGNQKMKVGAEDYLYLEADDFLWLHSPIVGEVWTKNELQDEWKAQYYINSMNVGAHRMELSGSEWGTDNNYIRVLLCVDSTILPMDEKEPTYLINYVDNSEKILLPIIVTCILCGGIIVGGIIYKHRKRSAL